MNAKKLNRGLTPVLSSWLIGGALIFGAPYTHAGFIEPGTQAPENNQVLCSNTGAFSGYGDCVGMVTDPNNDVGNNPTLIGYLNQTPYTQNPGMITITPKIAHDASFADPWGVVGDWVGLLPELQAGDLSTTPTTRSAGAGTMSVTKDSSTTGNWSLDVTGTDVFIDYVVVSVKGAPGWSAYLFDLTDQDLTSFSTTWDTLGLSNGNPPTAGPGLSHIHGAFITGTRDDDVVDPQEEIPTPGTLLLLAAPLIGMGAWRRRRS